MKNRLSAVLCLAGASIFFACQKTHDLSPPNHSSEELLSTSTGDVAMESVTGTCGQFRTQSQGGWGVNPVGENPGTYLRDHFAASFPSGLTVGYSGGYTVSFTSAAAVTEFLPAGGTALALTANSTNPLAKSIKNVLIGQVAALAINLAFDYNNPDFAPAEENLGNMLILTGAFSGMSVNEFLGIANSVLGGYSNAYSADQVNTMASLINANYIDGTVDGGVLGCPTTRFER